MIRNIDPASFPDARDVAARCPAARLIDKGFIYTTSRGHGDFTVPQFGRYMRRNHDLAPPPLRR